MIASRDIQMHLWWWQFGERWSVHHMFGNGIVHQALITHQAGPELWINTLSLQQLQLQHIVLYSSSAFVIDRVYWTWVIFKQLNTVCYLSEHTHASIFSTVCWTIYDTVMCTDFSFLPFVQYCSIAATFRSMSSRRSWILLPWPLPGECGQMHRPLWGSPCWRRWWRDWGWLCHQMHRTCLALYWGTSSCTSNTCPPFLSLLAYMKYSIKPRDSQSNTTR